MKIYYTASPRGFNDLSQNYNAIYDQIEKLDHTHVTDFIKDVDVDRFYRGDFQSFQRKTTKKLKKSDICVFEVSTPSLAIGHLFSTALQVGKPVIALYVDGNKPHFFTGVEDDKLQICKYNLSNLSDVLSGALDLASDLTDVRFNFFISPAISNYLDWIAKNKKIPRSVYLRNLIQRDMENDEEYKQ